MKFILKKLERKKDRSATFVCSLSYKTKHGKIITVVGKIKGKISKKILGKKVLDLTLFLYLKIKKLLMAKCLKQKR